MKWIFPKRPQVHFLVDIYYNTNNDTNEFINNIQQQQQQPEKVAIIKETF